MEKEKKYRVIFDLPGEVSLIDIINKILSNSNLEESSKEFSRKMDDGIEPMKVIIRDAALAIFKKKLSEEKIIELLAKHLGISGGIATQIVNDIKQEIIPYAKVVEEKEEIPKPQIIKPEKTINKSGEIPFIQQSIVNKLAPPKEVPQIETTPINQEERKVKTVIPQEQEKKGPDDYREAID